MVCFYRQLYQKIDLSFCNRQYTTDNTDLKIDTFDGKNQLHGTAIAVYQTTNGDKQHEAKAHLLLHFVYFRVNKCKLQV